MKNKINSNSRLLEDLIPEFRTKVQRLLDICSDAGYKFIPYSTLRGPGYQAGLYRQGRTQAQINATVASLRRQNAPFIADLLLAFPAAPKEKLVTKALPGQSWHQYGEAVDCYFEDPKTKKANWNNTKAYKFYSDTARSLGLMPGADFKTFPEYNHVQFRKENPPGVLSTLSSLLERTYSS